MIGPDGTDSVTVMDDGTIGITLRENPSTGYVWRYAIVPGDALTIVDDRFSSDRTCVDGCGPIPPMVGVGGTHTYRLRPVRDGHVTIHLVLQRGPSDVISELTFAFIVENGVPIPSDGVPKV